MRVIKSETTCSVSPQRVLWSFLSLSSCLCSVVVVICGVTMLRAIGGLVCSVIQCDVTESVILGDRYRGVTVRSLG
jgi:hypothetical protein